MLQYDYTLPQYKLYATSQHNNIILADLILKSMSKNLPKYQISFNINTKNIPSSEEINILGKDIIDFITTVYTEIQNLNGNS